MFLLTVHVFKDVEDGKYLSVVGHQSQSYHVTGHHKVLQDLQRSTDHLSDSCVQGIYEKYREVIGQRDISVIYTVPMHEA